MNEEYNPTARSRRCYHRVISGLKRGGQFRFLTLTSSDAAPEDIQRSWRCLYMRLKRRGLMTGYIKVPEVDENGRKHLHILFRGSYIDQSLIKKMWSQIHLSSIVDIRFVKPRYTVRRMAAYMAKYMSKELAGRYSWSWLWVWKGFCRDWRIYKRWWWLYVYHEGVNEFANCILGWDMCLEGKLRLDFRLMDTTLLDHDRSWNFVRACVVPVIP